MKCPIDQTDLVMSDRQGVEIDYCPQCRGVWLDRGELDKIIDRVAGEQQPATSAPAASSPGARPGGGAPGHGPVPGHAGPQPGPAYPSPAYPTVGYPQPGYPPQRRYGSAPSAPSPDDYRRGGYDQYGRPFGRKKRGGLLGELFDF
ncbi:hypothetical protein GXB85_08865 [Cellulomonas sp. APG4]|uniref:TFIIB-type zinc ribbon-containing protein n=1 Tax=Cellulomonas sp. APG4 TaxID=1538656 RepID=UPI001379967C|nr:zf-TFIIB domain-containing protein [Cellulomonas sp. APG4]NCT91057.1 hypothetical protein [Cellulomonas sp. APG4]